MKICKCGKPLQLNFSTGKLWKTCPLCREAANTKLRAYVARRGGIKGIAKL
jgi:hypothetical protein